MASNKGFATAEQVSDMAGDVFVAAILFEREGKMRKFRAARKVSKKLMKLAVDLHKLETQ